MPINWNDRDLKIQLKATVDGNKLEQFITKNDLRSEGNDITGPEGSGTLETGRRYGLISVIGATPESARKIAYELAGEFNGIVY